MNYNVWWKTAIVTAAGLVMVWSLMAGTGSYAREAVAAHGASTPTPASEVVVLGSNAFTPHDGSTSLYIVGEVQNQGNVSVKFVKVVATLRDGSGSAVGAKSSYITVDVLGPSETSPFRVIISEVPEWTSYDLEITWDETNQRRYPLEVLTSTLSFNDMGSAQVGGKIKNTYDERCKFAQAVATLYDSEGEVLGTGHGYTDPSSLKPDQTAFFSARVSFWKHRPDTSRVDAYRIQAYSTHFPDASPWVEEPSVDAEVESPSGELEIAPSSQAESSDHSQVASSFPWGWVVIGILSLGPLGVGSYKLITWAIHRMRLRRHLQDLRARTSTLLNACEPLLRGDTPEDTALYQLFKSYGGEQYARLQDDVSEWLGRSQDALDDAFSVRQKLIAPQTRKKHSVRQLVHDWEMLYVTLAGNRDRIWSLTNDELHTLLDPIVIILNREQADVRLSKQLDDILRDLADNTPLQIELVTLDPAEVDKEGILGYLDRIKAKIAYVRDRTNAPSATSQTKDA